jgi:hypothetical protein
VEGVKVMPCPPPVKPNREKAHGNSQPACSSEGEDGVPVCMALLALSTGQD